VTTPSGCNIPVVNPRLALCLLAACTLTLPVACRRTARSGDSAGVDTGAGAAPTPHAPPPSPAATTSPAAATSPDAAAAAAAGPCTALAARFKHAVDTAPGSCATAADCACYNPVAAGLGCGGVTDRTTSATLATIEAEFHAAKCSWPLECAAWNCAPRCQSGHCTR
jgi:hypothetical protein